MEHAYDGGQLVLHPGRGAAFAQGQSSVLDGLQHAERLVERQHDGARN
ncbi:MAG: hypothetical protein AB7L17_16215 [Ilumatobacteraceae bacterium]